MKTKNLTLLTLLGGIIFALKLAMASLPNIEPVTLLIIVYVTVFKKKAFLSVSIYILLEILVYGFSIWSIGYCYIWFMLTVISLLLFSKQSNIFLAIVLATLFGLIFGALFAPISAITSGLTSAIIWWLEGLPYDIIHAIANFGITAILYLPLTKLLQKLYMRY